MQIYNLELILIKISQENDWSLVGSEECDAVLISFIIDFKECIK